MLESFADKFEYQKLTPEERESRNILGELYGPLADTTGSTRNGRKYSKDLWEKVFADPIMQEKIKNHTVFAELGHPEDRAEIDIEKVCACLADQPKIGKDGKLWGVFHILDTPNGRILKTLCEYGTTVGVSSRGTGDLYTDENGDEAVDPDTYECECFDVVLLPAVESARMTFVESYQGKTLKQALREEYDKATDEEKKVMKETFEKLDLDEGIESASIDTGDQVIKIEVEDKEASVEPLVDGELSIEDDNIDEFEFSGEETDNENEEADDDGSEEIVESLQKALRKNHALEKRIEKLQTQLSVSNAKGIKLGEEVEKYKQSTQRLSMRVREAKDLKEQVSQLESRVQNQKKRISALSEKLKNSSKDSSNLNETVQSKDREIRALNRKIEQLNSKLDESAKNAQMYYDRLGKAKELVEKYKRSAQVASERYISAQAKAYGLSAEQVSNQLSESFTLREVDKVCESLASQNLRISKLPFDVSKKVRIATESKAEPILGESVMGAEDDVVDESLLRLANIS